MKPRKRKRKKERNFLLLDKSSLRQLNSEQRKALDSKHTILYPPILLVENAQHGLDQPSALFDFQNTVSVQHWAQRAKLDLLKGEPPRHYKIGPKIPTTSIYEKSDAERKEMQRQAIDIVRGMEAEEDKLRNHISVLLSKHTKVIELVMNHRDFPDQDLLREFNRRLRESSQNYPLSTMATFRGRGSSNIAKIRKFLDSKRDHCEALCVVDTLEKAYGWVSQTIYSDTETILRFLCKSGIILFSCDEKAEIFNRFSSEGKSHIDDFAPYARIATQLYLTIFLYLVENGDNSSPRGALRDFEYLYYAIATNVTFISSDKWHKRCVEEIPMLEPLRRNFKFLPHINKDAEEHKKVLKSIGIKA